MFVLLLAVCVLPGLRIASRGQFQDDGFSREQTRALKGVFALVVLLHHLCAYLSAEFRSLLVFQYAGFISIGAFFFISGYGLHCSTEKNPHYLRGFFRRRMLAVLLPYYIINTFYCIIHCVEQDAPTALRYIVRSLFGLHLWYVPVMILLYAVFYLAHRFLPHRWAPAAVTATTVLYMTGMYCLYRFGEFGAYGFWWYNSAIAFPLGIWYGQYRKPLHNLMQKKYPLWAAGALMGFILTYLWISPRHNNGTPSVLLMQILCVILFCLTLAVLSQKIHIDNPCLRFLGNHSFEIYLWHALFIALFRSEYSLPIPGTGTAWILFVENSDLYAAAVIASTLIAAWAVHSLCGRILGKTK